MPSADIEQIVNFTTVFLGLYFQAAPFLLLGTLASGLVEVLVSRDTLKRMLPRNMLLATLVGGFMGLVFPVCECGVMPLARRLLNKGLPVPAGIAFLLAAPIISPVVIASTFAAFGWSSMLLARIGLGLAVAVIVGMVFALNKEPLSILRADLNTSSSVRIREAGEPASGSDAPDNRMRSALQIAANEFFELGPYLILGSLLAAVMQALVPQGALLSLGAGPVSSVLAMQALSTLLSVSSTVDAFITLAFVNTFSRGSILAFLVFGAIVDIKSSVILLRVLKVKYAVYVVVLPLLIVMLTAIFANLNINW